MIQEAAKVGIYSLDFYAQQYFDPTGLGIPMAMEELFWGDAGIALSIVGTGLAAVGVLANGTEEQIGTWIPQMYGDANDVKVAAFCSSEPDAGSDVASMRTRAVRRGQGRVGPQRHEDLGDQRRHSQRPRRRGRRRRRAGLQGARLLHRPAEHARPVPGPEVQEARHPCLAHRRGRPGERPHPRLLPSRRQAEARRAPRAGP